ncbi:MAG: hypothetical protein IKR85_11645 [Clostridia bacterium]|nr:hypothetical protein [Clostridia bacterium]
MGCRAAVCGGSKSFLRFLELCSAELALFDSAEAALEAVDMQALFILPGDDRQTAAQLDLPATERLACLKQQGLRVYAEMYVSYNMYQASVFGCEVLGQPNHITGQALCAEGTLKYRLGGAEILQATNAAYLPARAKLIDKGSKNSEVLLRAGSFLGAVHPLNKSAAAEPVLIRSGSVFTALIALSRFDTADMRPYARWKQLYAYLFSALLDTDEAAVSAAFEKAYPPLPLRLERDTPLDGRNWRGYCESALAAAVNWHFDSGIVLPGDGSEGSVEMIMSNTHEKYNNRRVDAGMYTGWLLYAAGRYFENPDWQAKGRRIFDYFAVNGQLGGGTQDGLYRWYFNKYAYPRTVFSIDAGRCGIALVNMYRLTGERALLDRITRLADAFCRWGQNGLFNAPSTEYSEPPSDAPFEGTGACTASIYAEDAIFLACAHSLTGKAEYLNTLLGITDRLADAYPDYMYYGHTTSSRNARLLAALLAARRTGKRRYSELINRMIDYLAALRLPCGGIYCEDNLSFEHYGVSGDNPIGENGITVPWEDERISDQLYCVNNALVALSLLRGLEDERDIHVRKGLETRRGLLEYIVRIQIGGSDTRFAGGWMRAFDMTLWEYYGMDIDKFWGAYCIMAGWTMGILPLALLEELSGECFYAPYVNHDPGE